MDKAEVVYRNEIQGNVSGGVHQITHIHSGVEDEIPKNFQFQIDSPVDNFTGRTDELVNLHEEFTKGNTCNVISQIKSISGLGGIGKTQLARKYIQTYGKEYQYLLWIEAESTGSLENTFVELAFELGLGKDNRLNLQTLKTDERNKRIETIVEDVYRKLKDRKTLVILDNAVKLRTKANDSEAGIDKFIPKVNLLNNIHVLITSRNSEWGESVNVLELKQWKEEEAAEFVRKSLKLKNNALENKNIKKLLEMLQCFPLAMQQAVAYIKAKNKALKHFGKIFDIDDYVKRFEEETKKVLNFGFPDELNESYSKTTYTTLMITLQSIKKKEYGKIASNIFNILAYFPPDNIPVIIFEKLNGLNYDDEELGSAIELLKQYSIVNTKQGTTEQLTTLNIHRLVQQIIRIDIQEQSQQNQVLEESLELLGKNVNSNIPELRYLITHVWKFVAEVDELESKHGYIPVKYIENCLVTKQGITNTYDEGSFIDSVLFSYQKNEKRIQFLQEVEKLILNTNIDEREVVRMKHTVAICYNKLNNKIKCKDLHEEALKQGMRIRGISLKNLFFDSGEYGWAKMMFYSSIFSLESFDEITELEKQGEQTMTTINKEEYEKLAKCFLCSGELHTKTKEYENAIKGYKSAIKIYLVIHGKNSIEVAEAKIKLAYVYDNLKEYAKAEEMREQALSIPKQIRKTSLKIAEDKLSIANFHSGIKDYSKAIVFIEQAISIFKEVKGEYSIDVADALLRLADVFVALKEHTETIALTKHALQILVKVKGEYSIEVAKTTHFLANQYVILEDYEKALELREQTLGIFIHINGAGSIEVLDAQLKLADLYYHVEDFAKAINLREQALDIIINNNGEHSIDVAYAKITIANIYNKLNDHARAIEMIEQALNTLIQILGEDRLEVANVKIYLAIFYHDFNNYFKAIGLLEQALGVLTSNADVSSEEDSLEVVETKILLASLYSGLDNYVKVKDLLENVIPVLIKQKGSDNVEIASNKITLADAYIYLHEGNPIEMLEEALPVLISNYSADNLRVAQCKIKLGIAYCVRADYSISRQLIEDGLDILYKNFIDDDEFIAETKIFLAETCYNLNNLDKAKNLIEEALVVLLKRLSHDSVRIGLAKRVQADIYYKLGYFDKENRIREEAVNILTKFYGPEHDVVVKARSDKSRTNWAPDPLDYIFL